MLIKALGAGLLFRRLLNAPLPLPQVLGPLGGGAAAPAMGLPGITSD
jgi:hypothetical protein